MKKTTKIAIAVFAAVFLYMLASPYVYGNNGQPSGTNPAFPQVTPDGVFVPFATITTLIAAIGLAAKLG